MIIKNKYLRSLRLATQLSLDFVAAAVKMDPSNLSKVERCQRQATKRQRAALAAYFSLGWDELISEHERSVNFPLLAQAFSRRVSQ